MFVVTGLGFGKKGKNFLYKQFVWRGGDNDFKFLKTAVFLITA